MSFTKNLNKALLIGAVLIGEIVNGNRASFVSPMTHIALPQTLSPNSIEQLPKKTQNNLFTTAIRGLADQKFLNDYLMYISVTKGLSPRTVNEYYFDIRLFLRYRLLLLNVLKRQMQILTNI